MIESPLGDFRTGAVTVEIGNVFTILQNSRKNIVIVFVARKKHFVRTNTQVAKLLA